MKKVFLMLALALAVIAIPVTQTGCNTVTLEAGGAYTDVILIKTDQTILELSKTLSGFVEWTQLNAAFLAKYPQILDASNKVRAQKDGWIKDAYAARDAYGAALKAYREGKGSLEEVDKRLAALNGAIAVINHITTQIQLYKAAHPNV